MPSTVTKGIYFYQTVQSKLKSSDRNVYHWQVVDGITYYTHNAPTVCDVVSWWLSHASLNSVRIKLPCVCSEYFCVISSTESPVHSISCLAFVR